MKQEEEFGLHDDGNALRLVNAHGHSLKYVLDWGKWIFWDGKRWVVDGGERVMELARNVARGISEEATSDMSQWEHGAITRHAQASRAKGKLEAMVQLAASDAKVAIRSNQLDAHDMLLNVDNGVIDLREGKLLPHSPQLLLTKLVPTSFDPFSKSVEWERFVREACNGDTDLAQFLQRVVGYCLTGSTKEEVLFFVHGPGATGKSTFMDAVQHVLGEYSTVADFDTFVTRRGSGPRHDIARLAGARLVSSVEVNRGERLAEGLVKQITGGDVVTARTLYRESFEFRPRFKLVLVANDRPAVDHDDDAMWRRIVEIPFLTVVPTDRRDRTLKQRLSSEANRAAILSWAVTGCLDWSARGLATPASAQAAAAAYRSEMDTIGEFITDACECLPYLRCEPRELFDAFQRWAVGQRYSRHISKTAFYSELEANGFNRVKSTGREFFQGIRVRGAELRLNPRKTA